MEIKKNGFYVIKKEFFEKIDDPYIPIKEKRPVFFCIQDKKNSELWWVIPMTSQLEKANSFIQKYGVEKCYKFEINTTMDKSVFNIQDIFPITSKYIDREFKIEGAHFVIKDKNLVDRVEKKALKVISMAMVRKKIIDTSIDVRKIKRILEKEIENESKLEEKKIDTEELLKKISSEGIDRGNYNAFTGNEIMISDHPSNEKRWLSVADIKKIDISIKENEKPFLTVLAYKEDRKEDKIYVRPIKYYNISQLNITKEIEQKFVPIKEKEKTQEIDKSKEQGIGD